MKRYLAQGFFLCSFLVKMTAQDMEITDAATPPITPENLITNIFLGDGVEVTNVTYAGDPLAVGYFKNALDEVGIERGILLTSGRAASVNCSSGPLGADCNGTQFCSNDNNGNGTDPDLQAIASGTLFDFAKFTITFIPTSDTLRFKYVFASEEYPEWACTAFNDVFGFFISGPGINGPYQNNGQNIALIPGTNTPVTINNVNPSACGSQYVQYYNDNTTNNGQPVYDAYLSVFIAEAVVIPCETYTIKLMVSDVGDNAYDTGVFLEAKSFGTGSLKVETSTVSLDGTVTEDCASGSITFTYPSPVEADFPLDYTIIGTAQNGVDYLDIPLNLFIPTGDSSITIPIVAFEDGIPEGLETIGFDIQRDICNRDTFWVFIRDNEIVPPELGPDTTICRFDSVQLDGTLPIPLPLPPSFTNSQDYTVTTATPAYSPIQVAGVQPVTLGPGVIQSVCVNVDHNWVDDLDLFLISPSGQFIELSSDNGSNCDDYTNVCFTPTATNNIGAGFPWPPCSSGGQPSFANGTFAPEGVWSDLWDGDYLTNGTWQLLVLDDQMGFNGTILDWTITFEPLYQLFYEWTPAAGLSCTDCPNPIASPDQTTTYYLSASDTYGCMVYDSITIVVNDVLPPPNVTCSDITNNSITFNWDPIAGAMGYMVSINGGPFTQTNNLTETVNGLTLSEDVTIEVYGIGECNGLTGTATCSTPACTAPGLMVASQTNITCNGDSDGTVTLQASGGAGDYVYTFNGVNNMTGIYTGVAAGTYTATVLDSWACPNNITVTVSAPQILDIQPNVVNPISCYGIGDAVVAAPVTGGTAPYSFVWNNGQTDSVAINLGPGLQIVTVMDANGCSASDTINLTQPSQLTLNPATDSAACFGAATGGALVIINGGTSPHDILWDAAAGNATTDLATNLLAGSYTVTVTDFNGCSATATATVLEPSAILPSITPTNPLCNGGSTGFATASATGGAGGFQYAWSNGDTGQMADMLSATSYTVTVTDANGCTATQSTTLTDPPAISLQLTPTNVLCFGQINGTITTVATGGTAPLTYLWSNGATTPNLSGVIANSYCLTITDGNGCTATACSTVNQPSQLQLSTVPTNTGCIGSSTGQINLTVLGGSGSYQFAWDNNETTEDLTGLGAGPFSVTVTDANGCTATISETVGEDMAVVTQLSQQGVRCLGGSDGAINTTVTGGSGVFNYGWTGPNGFTSTSQNLDSLAAGTYYLTVSDVAGCAVLDSINVTEESALTAELAVDYVTCFGKKDGRIEVIPMGGNPPYKTWFNDEAVGGTTVFTRLDLGLYDIVIQDAFGCEWVQEQIYVDEPKLLTVNLGPDTMVMYNSTLILDPVIQHLANAGTAMYLWESNNPLLQPVDSTSRIGEFIVVSPASVTFTVTDENGCTAEDLINIFVRELRDIQVPSGFAPGTGGNPLNDLLHVHGSSEMVKEIKLFQVFDRWGERMYEAANFSINDPAIGWDGTFKGKDMPAGVYVWYLEVDFIDDVSVNYRGGTTLVR
ncbi:MAG: choice-of-anchor L domain-containing protein [Saprospiraceae bacterium]|nr:choice-of-anchor L domain-containing protein [Saprospiraceae bacterium]MCF8250387.1 choice-of-anchor L domain-containing protein [Saprospiraceae bacterium]MCF8281543.1 choice-of-anchor L domain-containing protein [Bacteroidales bacterium]MCF8312238.1 choice-of-anchor L domain-containing protein [Saprospiraceae bacterium]MCF8440579.1 choice-of-anchor L domain-containing protein [Saprospiraceae bacterium]